jgi:GNAT superfamily N-acetyltransferase
MKSIVDLVVSSPHDPDSAALILELNELLDHLYDPDENHFRLDAHEVTGDRGIFILARLDGRPVGCGALRLTADGKSEIKRMYVRPAVQGRGVGRMILSRLEDQARRLGATGILLEMGDGQPEARALYESAGFAPVPCWGEYLATPGSVCLGKDL